MFRGPGFDDLIRVILIPVMGAPVELFINVPDDDLAEFPHSPSIHAFGATTYFEINGLWLFGSLPEHIDNSARLRPNTNLEPLFTQLLPTGPYLLVAPHGDDVPAEITPANVIARLTVLDGWEDEFIAKHELHPQFPVEVASEATVISAPPDTEEEDEETAILERLGLQSRSWVLSEEEARDDMDMTPKKWKEYKAFSDFPALFALKQCRKILDELNQIDTNFTTATAGIEVIDLVIERMLAFDLQSKLVPKWGDHKLTHDNSRLGHYRLCRLVASEFPKSLACTNIVASITREYPGYFTA